MDLLALLQAYFAADDTPDPDEALLALAEAWTNRAAEGAEPITDEDLDALLAGLMALGAQDDAGVALIVAAADTADEIRVEQTSREEAAAQEEADAEEARRRLRGEASDVPAEGEDEETPAEGDGDEGDGGDGGDGGETPPAEGDDSEGADETEGANTPEPVSATALSRAARRQRARATQPPDEPPAPGSRTSITAAADLPDRPTGGVIPDLGELDRLLYQRFQDFQGASDRGGREKVRVARLSTEYPEDRRLGDNPQENARIVTDALRPAMAQPIRARVAAGGLCAPLTPIYSIDVFGDDRRPVKDTALATFQGGGDRGGVISMAPPILPNVAGASIIWTEANDTDPGTDGPATKPCLRVECGTPRETVMYAVPMCLEVGNFMAMTYGEWTGAWSTLAGTAHARLAEVTMLARIKALSTEPDVIPTVTSAVADTVIALDQWRTGFISRHRASPGTQFRVIGPETWQFQARANMARALPGGSFQENLVLAEQRIQEWFTSKNMSVTWTPDLGIMGQQAAATPLAEPDSTQEWAIYPEGTFIGIDRARLDLGIIRDSGLIATNDAQMFLEDFEAVHMIGVESGWLTINTCASGAVNGTLDPAAMCASYSAP